MDQKEIADSLRTQYDNETLIGMAILWPDKYKKLQKKILLSDETTQFIDACRPELEYVCHTTNYVSYALSFLRSLVSMDRG